MQRVRPVLAQEAHVLRIAPASRQIGSRSSGYA
jgi:hypothetical protein